MKRIYAILWVDDAGSMPLSRKDMNWYHRNAGPVSFAWEKDERFPWSSLRILEKGGANLSHDYLSHHLHPVVWADSSLLKKIYDQLRLPWTMNFLIRLLRGLGLTRSHIRLPIYIFTLLFASALVSYLFFLSKPLFIILLLLYAASLLFIGLWLHIRPLKMPLKKGWKYTLLESEWNRRFLLKIKEDFKRAGYLYPAVIRHGWNLPPARTMEFYMLEMNVLADASAVLTEKERYCSINDREVTWNISTPYYASLSKDYNIAWDGGDEEDRGLVELPLTLGNIATYGFGDEEKERIEKAPEDGLVSVYIHPWDDFSQVKEWILYLKTNYDVKFVRADEYVEIYMRKHPRPMVVDKKLNVYWALQKEGRLYTIRGVDQATVSLVVTDKQESSLSCVLKVNTEGKVPIIWIDNPRVMLVNYQFASKANEKGTFLTGVSPGEYKLIIELKG